MFRPEARTEVVAALLSAGGSIHDPSGRVTATLQRLVGDLTGNEPQVGPLGDLVRRMCEDQVLDRKVSGRRTFQLSLTGNVPVATLRDAGRLLDDAGVDDVTELLLRHDDVRDLAEILLASPQDHQAR